MNASSPVLIIGAGWAGMAAALELDRHGIPVTVLESGRRPGGRARTVEIDGLLFDNGQHLLIGAYEETLRLLSVMGVREEEVLLRQPLHLEVLDKKNPLRISTPMLPAPLHLVFGLLGAKGISASDKMKALRMSFGLALRGYRLDEDISVQALLNQYGQSPELIRRFWEPLCLATLNTPIDRASATVFLRVLKDSFSRRRKDADLLIPRVPLGELFCESAANWLKRKPHNQIHLSSRVMGIGQENGQVTGVTTATESLSADDVVLAISPEGASRLLAPIPQSERLAATIAGLGSQPITTVYLHYPDAPALPQPMIGLSGTLSQWIFERAVCHQPGWFAVVISAEGEHSQWDKQKLARHIERELAECLPGWPAAAEQQVVIREKRATFECRVGIEKLRPDNASGVDGLWLAGDYTATGYPATLEGAVRSGVSCARRIIARRQN